MEKIFLILSGASILMMSYSWYKFITFRKKLQGGSMKHTSNIFAQIIGIEIICFLSIPFLPIVPWVSKEIIMGIMFFFAALFVLLVINLFTRIVSDLGL
jgi:putative flippase GtrA